MCVSIDLSYIKKNVPPSFLDMIQNAEAVEIVRESKDQVKIMWFLENETEFSMNVPKKYLK